MLQIDVLTTFPEMFTGPLDDSIIMRARDAEQVEINIHNLRDFTTDPRRKTDDAQYGGGEGMIMLAEPILKAVDHINKRKDLPGRVIFLTPCGQPLVQEKVVELSLEGHLIFLCGHYKGVDERVIELLAAEEISIGDYILTGGEIPTMVLIDAITRLVPGVVGEFGSALSDSFMDGLLDAPRYTRPREVRGLKVPEILLGGNHHDIENWRHDQSVSRTKTRRPDLWQKLQSEATGETESNS